MSLSLVKMRKGFSRAGSSLELDGEDKKASSQRMAMP